MGKPRLKGLIFDLDGTLVDSRLDFDKMREEIGIPSGHGVLEFVEAEPDHERRNHFRGIVDRHEMQGALDSVLMPGVDRLLQEATRRGLLRGIFTRNRIAPTRLVIERLRLEDFSCVLSRDEVAPKPDPEGLLRICSEWKCEPGEVLFFGDYVHDVEAGRRAGVKTVLYLNEPRPGYADEASLVIESFAEFTRDFQEIVTGRLGFELASIS